MSNNVIVLNKLNQEKEYKKCSSLPNVNPRWPQLSEELPLVCLDHEGIVEFINGLNLNNCWPEHVIEFILLLDKT